MGHVLWVVVIGLAAGWLAGVIMKGRGFGIIGDLVVGVVGAGIGNWLFSALGVVAYGSFGTLVTALAGAIVLLGLVSLVKHA